MLQTVFLTVLWIVSIVAFSYCIDSYLHKNITHFNIFIFFISTAITYLMSNEVFALIPTNMAQETLRLINPFFSLTFGILTASLSIIILFSYLKIISKYRSTTMEMVLNNYARKI